MARIVFLFLCIFALWTNDASAQTAKRTVLSAEIYGYQQEMVYFDCVQTPQIRQEFYSNPGEEHVYAFETEDFICMLINGKTRVLLQPGDSLHVNLQYEGRNVQHIEYSGSEQAVRDNRALQGLEALKRDMRYKSQLLGCAALDVKPKDRISDSRTLLERARGMVDASDSQLSEAAKSYILADVESDVYMSLMEYPVMYASIRHLPVEQQEIGDYWKLMEGYSIRTDKASLLNPSYISLMMRYCFYDNEKKAHEAGEKYAMPTRFEGMYEALASFYTDDARDAVLYNLICNFIRAGKEIERVDSILEDYKKKYNKNPQYIQILDSLLQ